jgi:Hint domain
MEILTPQGPRRIETLQEGDEVLMPPSFDRVARIERFFSSTYIGTSETIPVRIPKDFFEPNVPDKDVLLSPHHAIFHHYKWRIPIQIEGLQQDTSFLGKEFTYYHIALPEYEHDKLWCHNLPVDSWDTSKTFMDPLDQEREATLSPIEKVHEDTTTPTTTSFSIC